MNLKPFIKGTILVGIALALICWQRTCSEYKSRLADTSALLGSTEARIEQLKMESDLGMESCLEDRDTLLAWLTQRDAEISRLKNLPIRTVRVPITTTVEVPFAVASPPDTVYYPETMEETSTPPYVEEDSWNYFEAFQGVDGIEVLYSVTDSVSFDVTYEKGRFLCPRKARVTLKNHNPIVGTIFPEIVVPLRRRK